MSKRIFVLWERCCSLMHEIVAMGLLVPIAQLFILPLVAWLFQEPPYSWTALNRMIFLGLLIALIILFFAQD